MGLTYFENVKKLKAYLVQDTQSGFKKIYRMYHGSERIYPNAGTVTYHVDTNVIYTEEVDIDESVLNPSTFTPSKSGWTFIGWREDLSANSTVLSNKIMTGDDVDLYAVFRQTITLSYNGNGATGGSTASQTGYRYYNNGNTANPSFILRSNGFTRTNYSFTRWRMGSASGAAYNAGQSVTISGNTTFYAEWNKMYVDVSSASGSYADEIALYRPANTTTNDSSKVVPFPISASGDAFQNGGSGTISVLHYVRSATITFSGTGRNAYSGAAAGEKLVHYYFALQILINGSVVKTQTIETGRQYPYDEDGGKRSGTVSHTCSLNAGDKITLKIFFTQSGAPNTGTPQCNVGSMSFSITGYSY